MKAASLNIFIVLSCLFLSCMKEKDFTIGVIENEILFTVSETPMQYSHTTKAAEVLTLDSMNVTASYRNGDDEISVFENTVFVSDGYCFKGGVVWPNEDPGIRFFASNATMGFGEEGAYIDVNNTEDIVYGYILSPVFNATNALHLSHLLARVSGVEIQAVEGYDISNVNVSITPNVSGRYTIATGQWSSIITGSQTLIYDKPTVGSQDNDLWLIPGDFILNVSWIASNGYDSRPFTDVPVKVTLEGGRKNIIRLKLGVHGIVSSTYSKVDIFVDKSELIHDYLGSHSSFSVSSGKTTAAGTEPSPWVTKVKDGDRWISLADAVAMEQYSWLSEYPLGESTPMEVTTVHSPRTDVNPVYTHERMLREGKIFGLDGVSIVDNSTQDAAVDLSMYDFMHRTLDVARYTANCYVISSPGWYKFPLVYGNAIENSATNTSAFKSSSIGTGHLDGFKNYKHNLTIADPWIENDWHTYLISKNKVQSASVQWQQYSRYDESTSSVVTSAGAQGVLDNISVTQGEDGRYILFHISEENIRQGNFLLCAKDAGGDSSDDEGESGALTMWSWHIWICGYPLSAKELSNGTDSYTVLPVNTGWIDGQKGLYHPRREVVLRFDSLLDPDVFSDEVTVVQEDGWDESVSGWCPYYQWGRKDPFVPGLFTYSANYDTGIRGSVRHPERFNSEKSTYLLTQYYYDWATNNYDNLWDGNWNVYGTTSGSLPASKTVMDPSPRRFCVAPDLAWDGLVAYGYEGDFDGGYHFYTSSLKEETLFFPATGYIGYDGVHVSDDSRYWTLHAWASMQRRASYSLRFSESLIENCFYEYNHRATGQPIRSVFYH